MIESMRLASEVVKVLNLDDSRENRGRYYSPRAKKKTNVEKRGPWHRNLTGAGGILCLTGISLPQDLLLEVHVLMALCHLHDWQHPWDKGSLEGRAEK